MVPRHDGRGACCDGIDLDRQHASWGATAQTCSSRGKCFNCVLAFILSDFGGNHKLVLAIPNGFFIFFDPPVFGWYLSSTAVLLITSWSLHNVIGWIKNKPFLAQTTSRIYIGTVILVQSYWVLEIYANFTYFNGLNEHLFVSTRPYEALCR